MYSSGLGAPSSPPSSGGSSAKTLKLRTSVMLRAMLSPWVLILAVYTVVLLDDCRFGAPRRSGCRPGSWQQTSGAGKSLTKLSQRSQGRGLAAPLPPVYDEGSATSVIPKEENMPEESARGRFVWYDLMTTD